MRQLGLGTAALRYQQMGYEVLPLAWRGKRPHPMLGDRGGVHWATRDPAFVWWAWPQDRAANVGIRTGSGSRLACVDLDVKHRENGPANFDAFLQANNLQVPRDVRAMTPSGGYHIWLRTPPGWTVPTRHGLLPGVDIQGQDSYVAAWPSHVLVSMDRAQVNLPYSWVRGCPCSVPMAPDWFLAWIERAPATGTAHGGGSGEPVPDIGELAQTGLPVGERHHTLLQVANSLFARYGTDQAGQAAVRAAIGMVLDATDCRGFGRPEIEAVLGDARGFISGRRQAEREALQDAGLRAWLAGAARRPS
jgi:hypothetical protein